MLTFFSHLKLRDRTLIGYSVPIILIFAFSGMVYVTASKVLTTFEQGKANQAKLLLQTELLTYNLNSDRRVRRYLLDSGSTDSVELFRQDQEAFQTVISQLKSRIIETDQTMLLDRQQELQGELVTLGQSIFEKTKAANTNLETLRVQYVRQSLAITNEFEQVNKQLNQKLQDQANSSFESAKSSIVLLEIVAVLVTLLVVIVTALMALMIANALGKRVTSVVNIAEKISTGDLGQVVHHASSSQDEIGQLMASFQHMIQRLNNLVGQVQRASIQVTASCTQLSASGHQLEGTMTEQLASTNQVTTTAKQIAATSEELVNTMEEIANRSLNTTHTASMQQQDLVRMGATMQQLAGATELISAKLGTISEKANNITTIVSTITKVADQTNLLSLNAAIEAEKAGESGLGFSVVAKEIRRLADQTAIATVDIEQMIKEMQSAVSTGVMEMDKFSREVRQGVTEVVGITAQVGQVIEQVQDLSPRFEAVSQGMETQFQGAQQISEAMMQLSSASAQTADSLQEINRVIEHLNQAEQGLRREVMTFKLADQSNPNLVLAS
jgi:methyl-accepting chemotaxis protein WspA